MSYLPVLALGGERALTLWVMISGWAAIALFYCFVRRYIDRRWSLAFALILLTTPAVLFGAGSGQVELRMAMFALVAAFAVADPAKSDNYSYAVIAGLTIGFVMGSKFTGLLFAFACALPILVQRNGFRRFLLLSIIGTVAGGQWYVWNFLHTGDPVFPMLAGLPGFDFGLFWDAEHRASIQDSLFNAERAVPTNLLWLVAYPFVATLNGFLEFESGRTGFGPYILLALPFATFGLWHFRDHFRNSPLLIIAVIAAMFYVLWFFTGSSQRVRHLLPIYPLLLLCISVTSTRWAIAQNVTTPLTVAVLLTVTVQLFGHAVFSSSYLKFLFTNETRSEYFDRSISGFAPIKWINANLSNDHRIYNYQRPLNYLFEVPFHYGHTSHDALIDIRPSAADADRFWRQLKAQNITHLLVPTATPPSIQIRTPPRGVEMWRSLYSRGCLSIIYRTPSRQFGSRTLRTEGSVGINSYVLQLSDNDCPPTKRGN
ncbi:MAG: glycosyltransferase family 39 protein [Proteobacteria bacterium]|nr:glycosyltransferase family 39 protein [Pseudomonadota bacterium]